MTLKFPASGGREALIPTCLPFSKIEYCATSTIQTLFTSFNCNLNFYVGIQPTTNHDQGFKGRKQQMQWSARNHRLEVKIFWQEKVDGKSVAENLRQSLNLLSGDP